MDNTKQAKLISQVLMHNNHHAFELLVKEHQSQIRNYARRLAKNDFALADDIAQETFILAFEKIQSYNATGSFIGWLLKICYRRFLFHIKKNKVELLPEIPEVAIWDNTEPMLMLEQAFKGVSFEERSAITLNASFGYTNEQVAEIMQLPLGTIKSHIRRGKTKLEQIINSTSKQGAA